MAHEKEAISTNQLVSQLLKVGHGDYNIYKEKGFQAAEHMPKILAHLLAWNLHKGEVRDSKVALPVLALRGDKFFHENAVSCLLQLSPRDILKGIRWSKELPPVVEGAGKMLKRGIFLYLKTKKGDRWDRMVLQHRKSVKSLYAMFHIKPNRREQEILFRRAYPEGSVFEVVRNLPRMSPSEAAGSILENKIPFLTLTGAIKGLKENKDLLMALVERMSGSELLNNTNALKKMGALNDRAIKSVYNSKIENIHKDKTVSTLKANKATEMVTDKASKASLKRASEEKLDQLKLDGDWLVLADKSFSMQTGIDLAKEVSAIIARAGKGRTFLVFFDTNAFGWEVTGMTLDEIKEKSYGVFPDGGTNIGAGLLLAREKGLVFNGIAICSDGGQNCTGGFSTAYKMYEETMGISPTVYLYRVEGDPDRLSKDCERAGISYTKHSLRRNIDYYSLPNLVNTMRSNRFGLMDEILETKLLTFKDI